MSRQKYHYLIVWLVFTTVFSSQAQIKQQDSIVSTPMKLIRPAYLQKGDTIAIIAPAGILKNRKKVIAKAKAMAESWGLHVVYGKSMFNQNHHFAGTDEERKTDFQKALDNPNIKAIWCARGGYGSVRILDQLDYTKFLSHPKWIIGYSDITAFHNHIHNLGVETIHGIMGTSFQDDPEVISASIASLKKVLFGTQLQYTIKSSSYNRGTSMKGELVGGNIAILASMLGSKSQISTQGKILFIEEIGEYKYSIDRMLQSLKRAGYFDDIKGIIVGDMSRIKRNTTKWGSTIQQLVLDAVDNANIPILFGFPAGHEPDNRALILGRETTVVLGKTTSTVTFE